MADKLIIGLCGKPNSGKSTIAKYLAQRHGFAHINVGDPIKWMLAAFYEGLGLGAGEIKRRLYGELKESPDPLLCGATPRLAMQVIGKEGRDPIHPMLFAKAWEHRVRGQDRNVVADGMRYADEITLLHQNGGILVEVVRPGIADVGGGHVAEAGGLDADVVLHNTGSLDELYTAAEALRKNLTKKCTRDVD